MSKKSTSNAIVLEANASVPNLGAYAGSLNHARFGCKHSHARETLICTNASKDRKGKCRVVLEPIAESEASSEELAVAPRMDFTVFELWEQTDGPTLCRGIRLEQVAAGTGEQQPYSKTWLAWVRRASFPPCEKCDAAFEAIGKDRTVPTKDGGSEVVKGKPHMMVRID